MSTLPNVSVAARRELATCITHIYRSKKTGGQAEDSADEEEIEVGIDGEFVRADEDAGQRAGFAVYGAFRIDNGAEVVLTNDEEVDVMIQQEEAAADAEEAYEEDAYDRANDR